MLPRHGREADPISSRYRPPKFRGPETAKYEVGYGKPPLETRFQPGQSGNPRGRPKASKSRKPHLSEERLKDILLAEAYRTIRINEGNRQINVPMAQAIIRSLAVNAVKGQQRSQRLFAELLSATERANRQLHDQWLDVAMTYKIEWDRELDRRARFGITGPEPLPHPDHVIFDVRNGTAEIRGPATREEKAEWDMWVEGRTIFQQELIELEALLDDPDCPDRQVVVDEIERTRTVLHIIARAVGPE